MKQRIKLNFSLGSVARAILWNATFMVITTDWSRPKLAQISLFSVLVVLVIIIIALLPDKTGGHLPAHTPHKPNGAKRILSSPIPILPSGQLRYCYSICGIIMKRMLRMSFLVLA